MRKVLMTAVLTLFIFMLSVSLAFAQADQAAIEQVYGETENVRGLDAGTYVPVNFLSRAQLEEKMMEDFGEENPEEEITVAEELMVMLGFIDENLDLLQFYIDLYTEQVAGFYDPEEDSLNLISEEESMNVMDKYTLSHEITHYLQDQAFDLTRQPFDDPEGIEGETDDDASFAATCLVEGDAMLTSELWLMEYADLSEMMELEFGGEEYSTEVFDSAPPYIRDSLLFPYEEGRKFVDVIYEEGGFAAVNKAFENVPASTEVIMHPGKYLEGEEVIPVEVPDMSAELGEGWELAYDNVLGEFDIMELFKPYLSGSETDLASEGWGGNNYHYYRNGDGDKLLVQDYAWDSEEDAVEFASAFVQYLQERFSGGIDEMDAQGAWLAWSTQDYRWALKLDGVNAQIVQATSEEPFEKALSALGSEGEQIEREAIEADERAQESGETQDYTWIVVAGVIALLIIGLFMVVVMLTIYFRRPPTPPMQPPGGPYMYPPGGGAGPYRGGSPYQGHGGAGGPGPGAVPGVGGTAPPPPPPAGPPPPPSQKEE